MRVYYIIESSGPRRQMWGPYQTLEAARLAAGTRHTVIRGAGLSDGQVMTSGELQAAVMSGRVWSPDVTAAVLGGY